MEKKWSLDDITKGLLRFREENGKYPTSIEFDKCSYLPAAKTIQRQFGGLVKLRELLNLEGPSDFTKGDYSSHRAKQINERSHTQEKIVYDFLKNLFGTPFVHREYLFDENKKVRVDFFVYTKTGNFAVDVFFPKDRASLIGCINAKIRTYDIKLSIDYPVVFLMMNDAIGFSEMTQVVGSRKKPMNIYHQLMNFNQFKSFCTRYTAFDFKGM